MTNGLQKRQQIKPSNSEQRQFHKNIAQQ